MTEKLEIFVCEFITGGGLYNVPLTSSLADEGEVMASTLVRDLLEIPGVTVTLSRDARLPAHSLPVKTAFIDQHPRPTWQQCIDQADLVWVIAPESDGVLEQLAAMVPTEKWIGCDSQSVVTCSSKHATAAWLARHGIRILPTWYPSEMPLAASPWIVKPDDGAGCLETRYFENAADMWRWLKQGRLDSHVVQPWLPGEAASLSVLCRSGEAWLLSANRQLVTKNNEGVLSYHGSVLNGMLVHWQAFEHLAQQIAQVMPGLHGYVGVDVMVDGDTVTVLEINPRLTTSYVGLHQATGLNPAGLVLDLHYNRPMSDLNGLQRNVVEICLNA
jgi:predicted ATP-grasp superfamily ATP-dependent carboligase